MTLEIQALWVPMGRPIVNYVNKNHLADFTPMVERALKEIRTIPLGTRMLDEIEKSTNVVKVYMTGEAGKNTCGVESEGQADRACYAEVLSDAAFAATLEKVLLWTHVTEEPPEVTRALEKLQKFTNKVCRSDKPDGPKKVPPGLAINNRQQRGNVAYYLRDHLTRGAGTNSYVHWNPKKDVVDADLKAAWNARPSWVALAHELIHAWRIVTGRVIFHPHNSVDFYYEEAMTVGLPPYDGCPYTENRFRQAKGLARRSFYGLPSQARTEKAAAKYG